MSHYHEVNTNYPTKNRTNQKKNNKINTVALVASPWLQKRPTKVITVVVPALVASSLLLIQTFFSIFIIFLPEIFILENFIGSIYLQELFMGWGVPLKHKTCIRILCESFRDSVNLTRVVRCFICPICMCFWLSKRLRLLFCGSNSLGFCQGAWSVPASWRPVGCLWSWPPC